VAELSRNLKAYHPDIVFNLAEAPLDAYEKEPHAAALLELLCLPYTGNGPLALALCKNKARAKELLQAHVIATPRAEVFKRVPRRSPALQFPMVVKPLRQDGSLGISEESVVEDLNQLRHAVRAVVEQKQDALAEEFVGGREFNVSILGNGTRGGPYRVLPPGEFLYHDARWRVCTFDAKWDEAHPSYTAVEAVCPAKLSHKLRRRLEELAIRCSQVFELAGYSRLDFRLDAAGEPHLLDVNPNPDVAPRMGIARAAETAGMSYPAFLDEILRLGLDLGQRGT
jgi:D-alanine-D-alanine ligase